MKKYILFFAILPLFSSCLKIDEASEIPAIKMESFTTKPEEDPKLGNEGMRVDFTISFTDGDGNISDPDSTIQNLFIAPFIKKYKAITDTLDTLGFSIPYVEPVKTVRIMKGEIDVYFFVFENSYYKLNDTIKYDIFLKDRAGNMSNIITKDNILFTKDNEKSY